MAALAETRDLGSHLPLPGSVQRLCCIGDSITYGQGVAPDETLAMHVARLANMAYPDHLVWVDNLGQSSGNLWHSWVPFARLQETVRYDAAIFSLCQNDAQIFEGNTVRYDGKALETWFKDGALAPVVRRTLGAIAQSAAQRGHCVILDFYTLWDGDAPIVEALAQECETIGLPFVDLLRFLKRDSGRSVSELVASPFDGHPSGNCHEAAARRLVDELRARWVPAPAHGALSERLVEVCDQAVRDGWSPDDVFHWALLVLDAKEVVARRKWWRPYHDLRQWWKPGMPSPGNLAAARGAIEDRYGKWRADRATKAQAYLFDRRRDELQVVLERAFASIRNLDELAFTLEHFQDSGTIAELWSLIDSAGYYNEDGRLQALPADLKARLIAMADASSPPDEPEASMPVMRQCRQLRRDLAHDAGRLAALLPDRVRTGIFDPQLSRLWQVVHYTANAARAYLAQFDQVMSELRPSVARQPVFFTNVDVWIERDTRRPKRGGLFNLTVEADYIEPRRTRQACKLWGGSDVDSFHYHFELPLLLLGDIAVGVPDWDDLHRRFLEGDLRIARVEISNSPGNDAPRSGRFVWEPRPDARSMHWLKFDRLLVPG